jgi:hypothetical protein
MHAIADTFRRDLPRGQEPTFEEYQAHAREKGLALSHEGAPRTPYQARNGTAAKPVLSKVRQYVRALEGDRPADTQAERRERECVER